METFYEFQEGTRKHILHEAPLRIDVPKTGWSSRQIEDLWDLVGDESPQTIGKIKGLDLVEIKSGPLKYFFLFEKEKPVFVVYVEHRYDIYAWQVKIAAKTTSKVSLQDFYTHLNRKLKMFIATGVEQSVGAEKAWREIMKTAKKYVVINDETGEELDIEPDEIWGNSKNSINLIVKLIKM